MIEKLIQDTALKDIRKIVHCLNDKKIDLNEMLLTSIERKEWLTVAKIVTIIQLNPNPIYISNLCHLINYHSDEFHPEEVVDAISDILDLEISEDDCYNILISFEKLLFESREDDPAFNINKKCLENLEWIVRLKMNVSKIALDLIEKATNHHNDVISNEAKQCIDSLQSDNINI